MTYDLTVMEKTVYLDLINMYLCNLYSSPSPPLSLSLIGVKWDYQIITYQIKVNKVVHKCEYIISNELKRHVG